MTLKFFHSTTTTFHVKFDGKQQFKGCTDNVQVFFFFILSEADQLTWYSVSYVHTHTHTYTIYLFQKRMELSWNFETNERQNVAGMAVCSEQNPLKSLLNKSDETITIPAIVLGFYFALKTTLCTHVVSSTFCHSISTKAYTKHREHLKIWIGCHIFKSLFLLFSVAFQFSQ